MRKRAQLTGKGPDWLSGLNIEEDEKLVRGELMGLGFRGDEALSPELANIGALLSSLGGDTPTTYLSKELSAQIAGDMYSEQDIPGMAYGALSITINNDSVKNLLSIEQIEEVKRILNDYMLDMKAIGE